jgi:hypothetical protein
MPRALLASVPEIGGRVFECASGDGAIARVLRDEGGLSVVTNDRAPRRVVDVHGDATRARVWSTVGPIDWTITNPPYAGHLTLPMLERAYAASAVGVAFLLRLSFLEPTKHGQRACLTPGRRRRRPASLPRGPWLAAHPPSRLLVLPRYSFTGGGTDSVTCAWMIWSRIPLSGPPVLALYDADTTYAAPWSRAAA